MHDHQQTSIEQLSSLLKPFFLKWEFLRLFYNLILVAAILIIVLRNGGAFMLLFAPFVGLPLLAVANVLYFLLPLLEAYIAWLGLRSWKVTALLFVGWSVISIVTMVGLWIF